MFRITNIQTRQQETCPTRDDLLSIINEKSVWAEDRRESFTLQIEQVAEDGELLDNMSLSLPLQSIVEEALSGFGLKREKRGFPLLIRKPQREVSKGEPTSATEKELVEPISAPLEETETPKPIQRQEKEEQVNPDPLNLLSKPLMAEKEAKPEKQKAPKTPKVQKSLSQPKGSRSLGGLFWKVLTVGALGLSISSLAFIQVQNQTIKNLEERISLEENQGRVEVVGRFFIANYYSGNNDNLKDFLSKDLKAEGVDTKSGEQVQSSIYETVSSESDTINVTFVVTTKGKDDSIKTARLTLPFQENDQSKYGYVLVGQPKFSSFTE